MLAHLSRGTSRYVHHRVSTIASTALLAAAVGFVVLPGMRSGGLSGTLGAVSAAEGPRSGSGTGDGADASVKPGVEGFDGTPGPIDPESLTGYAWPISTSARLTQPFGASAWGTWLVAGQTFHDGLDLATFCGDRIVAAHDGVVLAAGRTYDEQLGWIGSLDAYNARLEAKKLRTTLPIVVVIDDGNGYRSLYAHFSQVTVKAGDTVKVGQIIGYEGRTGNASGCHLHYGLFSPAETATFTTAAESVARMLLPPAEIARIDPLRVLPTAGRPAGAPEPLIALPALPTIDDWEAAASAAASASAATSASASTAAAASSSPSPSASQ